MIKCVFEIWIWICPVFVDMSYAVPVQIMSQKPLSEWIISVGRHEGFISSRQWIDTQNMLGAIAEKYNRPRSKTNALLSGLIFCPHCGKRLRAISESNRYTNGKPRFKCVLFAILLTSIAKFFNLILWYMSYWFAYSYVVLDSKNSSTFWKFILSSVWLFPL